MIPNIRKILFPTDLSEVSRSAFRYAVALADKFDAAISILHVMAESGNEGAAALRDFLGEDRWRQLQKTHEQEARQILIGKRREGAMIREALGAFAEKAGSELENGRIRMDEIDVVQGSVVEEIIRGAAERNCDLIVMGYRARGKIEDTISPGTTRRVLRRSRIPVMLVGAAHEGR